MVKANRFFNGSRFSLDSLVDKKRDAKQIALTIKSKGGSARVVAAKGTFGGRKWAVYGKRSASQRNRRTRKNGKKPV